MDPTACALSGGEDYELLFTIAQVDYDKLEMHDEISVVGYVTNADEGKNLITKGGKKYPLTAQGWNAFG
jgi:thiamine-monophosphate kinase